MAPLRLLVQDQSTVDLVSRSHEDPTLFLSHLASLCITELDWRVYSSPSQMECNALHCHPDSHQGSLTLAYRLSQLCAPCLQLHLLTTSEEP